MHTEQFLVLGVNLFCYAFTVLCLFWLFVTKVIGVPLGWANASAIPFYREDDRQAVKRALVHAFGHPRWILDSDAVRRLEYKDAFSLYGIALDTLQLRLPYKVVGIAQIVFPFWSRASPATIAAAMQRSLEGDGKKAWVEFHPDPEFVKNNVVVLYSDAFTTDGFGTMIVIRKSCFRLGKKPRAKKYNPNWRPRHA